MNYTSLSGLSKEGSLRVAVSAENNWVVSNLLSEDRIEVPKLIVDGTVTGEISGTRLLFAMVIGKLLGNHKFMGTLSKSEQEELKAISRMEDVTGLLNVPEGDAEKDFETFSASVEAVRSAL